MKLVTISSNTSLLATKKAAQWGEFDKKMEQEMLSSTKVRLASVVPVMV